MKKKQRLQIIDPGEERVEKAQLVCTVAAMLLQVPAACSGWGSPVPLAAHGGAEDEGFVVEVDRHLPA